MIETETVKEGYWECTEADGYTCLNLFQLYLFHIELKTGKEARETLSRQKNAEC